jgi:hypothetical protein
MSDFSNGNYKTVPVSDVGQTQYSGKGILKRSTRAFPGFERWLIEYQKQLAEVLQEETKHAADE